MIVDAHCDTLKECYKQKISITNQRLQFNITDTKLPIIQVLAIYISPEEKTKGLR